MEAGSPNLVFFAAGNFQLALVEQHDYLRIRGVVTPMTVTAFSQIEPCRLRIMFGLMGECGALMSIIGTSILFRYCDAALPTRSQFDLALGDSWFVEAGLDGTLLF